MATRLRTFPLLTAPPRDQHQSRLLRLPAEIRQIVFRHAVVECDDLSRPYNKHEPYYRHDFKFAGKITIALLLTCRQVYVEARLLPVAVNDHIFWQGGAPPGRLVSNHIAYFQRMSDEQRALVQRAHFFGDLPWLDLQGGATPLPVGVGLKRLQITIRHTAWKYWYDDYDDLHGQLYFKNPAQCWAGWVKTMSTLQEFVLVLESDRWQQLDERAAEASNWTFPLEGGHCLVHDGKAPVNSMHLLSSHLNAAREGEDSQQESVWDGEGNFDRTHWHGSDDEGSEDGQDAFEYGAKRDGDDADQSWADSQTRLDRKFPLDFVVYVRTLKFVRVVETNPTDTDSD
ncbi:hypothetical protein FB45DRAFT_1025064 [Roridomyces roridus]|uniref:Uncharacterized protein n=1 Tax=Roridomyces roridus TaxID=1738132 RepID=A0AAD7FTU5_9AGAR|nr:hypothetical protein FB45DRAFT_1025064 [Roridomyces roridus]